MGRAWLFSALLHTGLGALLYFGLPNLTRLPATMERSITVELVAETEAERTPPMPAPAATAPEPERAAAAPEPSRRPEPEPEPEPQAEEPAPEPQPVAEPEPEPAPPEPEPQQAALVEPEPPAPEPEPLPEPEAASPPEPEPEPEPAPEAEAPSLAAVEPEPAPTPPPQPEPERPAPKPQAAPAPKPRVKPQPPRTEAPPPPSARPEPPPAPKPPERQPESPAPQPAPPQEDAFAALLKSVEQIERRTQADNEQAGQVRSAGSEGQARSLLGEARLSVSEVDALRRQIGGCWTLPAGIEGLHDMVVQLRIQVRPDRTVQRVTIQDQGRLEQDPTFRTVAESARRAVDRCSPLNLPPDKYGVWRDIVMNFYPEDAISG